MSYLARILLLSWLLCIFPLQLPENTDRDSAFLRQLCPVSSDSHVNHQTDYFYPLEVYFPHIVSAANVSCWTVDRKYAQTNYSCPVAADSCPVKDYGNTVTNASFGWKKASDICSFKSHLDNPNDTVRVIVLGNSVAAGRMSQGCCSRRECEVNLALVDDREIEHCSWSRQLATWLNSTSAARVQWINMASSGYTSDTSHALLDLPAYGIASFTSRDLIFLDHSATDEVDIVQVSIDLALESLVRRLLYSSASLADLPTLVLLETDCRRISRQRYLPAYRRVAQHYGLRVYSLHDAIHAVPRPIKDPVYRGIHQHLTGDTSVRAERHHPPWHVHLYMADVIAATLRGELAGCSDVTTAGQTTPYEMPPQLVGFANSTQCSGPHVLYVNYENTMNRSLPSAGRVHLPSGGSWRVRRDHRGRGGFISELTPNMSCEVFTQPINFTWGMSRAEVASQDDLVLQMVFQRSHRNGGNIMVKLCGHRLHELDGLWNDYETFHYTLPFATAIPVRSDLCAASSDPSAPAVLSFHQLGGWCGRTTPHPDRQRQLFRLVSLEMCHKVASIV